MRYYELILNANADYIEANATIKLNDYAYDSPIEAMNSYMHKNLQNDVCFFVYRDEGEAGKVVDGDGWESITDEGTLYAVFAYDEKKISFTDAYDHVMNVLGERFLIKRVKEDPSEITTYQYYYNFDEAKRRGLTRSYRNVEKTWFWFSDYFAPYNNDTDRSRNFNFEEIIVPIEPTEKHDIYDSNFVAELKNIEEHKSIGSIKGNMVHYFISSRSREAAIIMTQALTQNLLMADRIKSRRISVISDIHPEMCMRNSHLEEIIKNNYGGTVVIDLSERFGFATTKYMATSKYIENLFKKYRNKCLFIFTYNMDNPGYSYQILPNIRKYAIPVALKEGRGNRRTAVKYMKHLIKKSEYAKYANQAAEFMKQFSGDDFSQTDVLMAYEQFEPWCVNKNIMRAYDHDFNEDFMADRDMSGKSSYEQLSSLIGLETVKKQIETILSSNIVEKERKKKNISSYNPQAMHMIFAGNPGTAKTTVARLFAGITKERGILKSGAFVMYGGQDLDTLNCVYTIRSAFLAAKGGVLFIDEAYALQSDTATTTLVQELENNRDDVIVILAGYHERMEYFMKQNEGLKSRVPHWVEFPDYDADELTEIFKLMIRERGFTVTDEAVQKAHYIFDKARYVDGFGNGRYVRNLIDQAIQEQASRLMDGGKTAEEIKKKDLFRITADDLEMVSESLGEEREKGTAGRELDEMIGLSEVKSIIRKSIANYKMNKYCLDRGITREKASMHMVFTGNPGTAKTTVARLFAEILKDEKVLPTSKFIEAGRADLIGIAVGSTAPIVKNKFKEAQGGVLFIDEAYSLCDDRRNSFGDEAISTIVQEMENHRDDVIVIFAGYPEPMKEFLERNPGMKSRIAFSVHFEDYTVDELCEITKLMARKKGIEISDRAMNMLRMNYEKVCDRDDYGNGRYVRKLLEEAEMNLAERVFGSNYDIIDESVITKIEDRDIPEYPEEDRKEVRQIGFAS